jgi:hypothetical protein
MAGTTGLEPAASAVTGQRSNQLNYVPSSLRGFVGNPAVLTCYLASASLHPTIAGQRRAAGKRKSTQRLSLLCVSKL